MDRRNYCAVEKPKDCTSLDKLVAEEAGRSYFQNEESHVLDAVVKIDTNGNGKVTRMEWNMFHSGAALSATHESFDEDAKQTVSVCEALDRDHDGFLSEDELSHQKLPKAKLEKLVKLLDDSEDRKVRLQICKNSGV